MTQVVIVDDQSTSRTVLAGLVSTTHAGVEVTDFADARDALRWSSERTPDLVLTDYRMPGMDGIEFIARLRAIPECIDVPVVMVTCVDDRETRLRALEQGATEFLIKPVDRVECKVRCHNLLMLRQQQLLIKDRARWLEKRVEQATADVLVREEETLKRLAKAGEYRDEGTGNHICRMAKYSALIGRAMGLSGADAEVLEKAAPMHDIGKIGIPDHILLKPGRHTPEEFELMKRHTLIGYEILRGSPSKYLQTGAIIALSHHERFNGAGYPHALAGEEIPLAARIVAVADVFDALTSKRPYKRAWSVQEALSYIHNESGAHFDPDCVRAFGSRTNEVLEIMDRFRDQPASASAAVHE